MPGDAVSVAVPRRAGAVVPVVPAVRAAAAIVGICAFLVLVGLFGQFANRPLVVGVLDIGHALMLAAAIGCGAGLARRYRGMTGVLAAILAGGTAGAGLGLLAGGGRGASLGWVFISVSPGGLGAV